MDIGSIWNSLYTSQLVGTQMYGLQSEPFSAYGAYGDVWQASPWQYGLQTGTVYANPLLQTWQNTGFTDTLNDALTKYSESLRDTSSEKTDDGMDVSTHRGNVLQLGYDRALVYLPEEQKIMIVQTTGSDGKEAVSAGTAENGKAAGSARMAGNEKLTVNTGSAKNAGTTRQTKTTRASYSGNNIEEKGILVSQRRAKASAAYRRTQKARQQNSIWAKSET